MSDLLTVTQIREHIQTSLVDDAVQRLINDADAEITRRLGPLDLQTEVLDGNSLYIFLQRKAIAIDSAVEREFADLETAPTDYTLSSNDYNLLSDGYQVERLKDGNNPHTNWRDKVTIIYVPEDETYQRTRILIDLVRLSIQYSAVKGQSALGTRVDYAEYDKEREKIFRGLSTQGRRIIT